MGRDVPPSATPPQPVTFEMPGGARAARGERWRDLQSRSPRSDYRRGSAHDQRDAETQ